MRAALATLAALTLLATTTPAHADTGTPWVGGNPYGFAIGDSIIQQCHSDFGMGGRSLGFIGWPGADSTAMRERLDSNSESWPYITESSHAEELTWFRDAGWLVIGLGTNDVKTTDPGDFADNIDWFMVRARNRPVLWFTIHNPAFPAQSDALNAVLEAKAAQYPNLRLLPWDAWADQHPDAFLPDGVHVATYEYGCQQGRNALIRSGAPAVDSAHALPVGYWYPDPNTSGLVHLNGWGAGLLPSSDAPVQVNVRSDYQHVGRFPVAASTGDIWAQAAGGRAFGVLLGPEYRGHLICLDLLDAAGQWTSLGCRTV